MFILHGWGISTKGFLVLVSVFLYAKCVSASQLNNEIRLQTSSNNLQAFRSVPKSAPEEFRRDKRRLEEDRRVNGQNSNTVQNSPGNRNPFDSLDSPFLSPKSTTTFNSNNIGTINPNQTPTSSFGDRLKPNRNDLSGHNSGSRRPSSSYANLSAPNNRLQPSRIGRRLQQDRNVNSKNQIILEKTTIPLGSTRRPGTDARNEFNPSNNQAGISIRTQFDGRSGENTRNRNQINLNRSKQANIDSAKDKTIKRPPIDYRTLLDNGATSSSKNPILKQESRKGKQHRNLFNSKLKLRKERLQKLRENRLQNGRSRTAKRLKELRQQRLSKQNDLFNNNKLNLDTYIRENNNGNDVSSSRESNPVDVRIVENNEQRNIQQSFNTFDDQRTNSENSRNQFENQFPNEISPNNFDFNVENPQTSSATNIRPDESDYLFNDYDANFIGNDYLNFEDDNDDNNDFSDYFVDAIPQKSFNEKENRNNLGVFIKEPNFAIDKTPEEFDRDQIQQRNKSRNKAGTNILEPKFSIDQDDIDDSFRGTSSQFDKSTSSGRGEGDLLEPDFALDYDIELPDSLGAFNKSNGIDIAEPDFAIDDFEVSNKTLNRKKSLPEGIIDFSNAKRNEDGLLCITKFHPVENVVKEPILDCRHKMQKECHHTYVTVYESIKESICQEHFEKVCQINFVKKAVKGVVEKCYNPFEKVCDGRGPESCKTFHETSCTTKYEMTDSNSTNPLAQYGNQDQHSLGNQAPTNFDSDLILSPSTENRDQQRFRSKAEENFILEPKSGSSSQINENSIDVNSRNKTSLMMMSHKKMLGVTKCEKIPVKLCGKGCRVVQKGEQCHNQEVDDVRNVPEEQCELNPRQSCRNVSKLVPKLKPVLECSMVPKEFCALKYGPPKTITNEQKSIWCLDEN